VPRFSVVVPTRDRPDFLAFCLEGLASQTFEDVEVIVSDNASERPARAAFDRWARPGWRYLSAERPLPMHENFERGCAEASGDYVAVVIDKTVLHASALEVADRVLSAEPTADIVTWWNEGYDPTDEGTDLGRGRFEATAVPTPSTPYDPAAELDRHFSNAARRGSDPVRYVRGKIVFGAYSRALLRRVREQTGRVFHPLAPDYTAMVPACVLARGAVDVGRPLLVSYNSRRSNGRLQSIDPAHARRFIETADPTILDALPIPALYTSTHNVVAYDLVSAAARCPGSTPELDLANLVRRAREDLAAVEWSDPTERAAQYAILEAAEARLGVMPVSAPPRGVRAVVAGAIARVPAVERLRVRATGGPIRDERPTYASPVEAAREADHRYAVSAAAER
jgi:hypothetical protein